jgi:hypothetical protein
VSIFGCLVAWSNQLRLIWAPYGAPCFGTSPDHRLGVRPPCWA